MTIPTALPPTDLVDISAPWGSEREEELDSRTWSSACRVLLSTCTCYKDGYGGKKKIQSHHCEFMSTLKNASFLDGLAA